MSPQNASTDGKRPNDRVRFLVGAALIVVLAFSLRIFNFSHEPAPDELYHLLAAESWSQDGSLAIGEGQYTRAAPFTRLIGVVFSATGGDLDAIRIFCIILGTIFVLSVFVAVRYVVGDNEALIAASMLALMPGAIFLSQFIRFYTLHALAFWLAAISFYVLMTRPLSGRFRILLLSSIGLLLWFALQLQVTTVIGILALLVWAIAIQLPGAWCWYLRQGVRRKTFAAGALLGVMLAGLILVTGPLEHLVESYQSSALWSSETDASYFALRYRDQYGVFWSLFPVAVILALIVNWRPAFFCVCIFSIAFVLHSFAGMRSERYLFYAMPFFATIWGISMNDVAGRFHRVLTEHLARLGWLTGRRVSARVVSSVVVALSALWLVLLTPATELAARMAVDNPGLVPRYWFNFGTSWESAQPRIAGLVGESDIFITTQGHHALYYIGDFDVEISATGLADFQSRNGGSDIDPRTGRRVIAEVEPLQSLVLCNASGIVAVDQGSWRRFIGVNVEVADFIEANLRFVSTPQEWGMIVYRWSEDDISLNMSKRQWQATGMACVKQPGGY